MNSNYQITYSVGNQTSTHAINPYIKRNYLIEEIKNNWKKIQEQQKRIEQLLMEPSHDR